MRVAESEIKAEYRELLPAFNAETFEELEGILARLGFTKVVECLAEVTWKRYDIKFRATFCNLAERSVQPLIQGLYNNWTALEYSYVLPVGETRWQEIRRADAKLLAASKAR